MMVQIQIPGYRVEQELGRGGMASVYLATQESVDRPVALKVMAGHLGGEAVFRERFIREGKLVARLNHPHIITIYDIGAVGDLLYIAMEYVSGGDLRQRLAQGTLCWQEAIRILKPLAAALHFAHQQRIIHRDIKPHNILFRGDQQPVLADFGIAKSLGSQTLTEVGAVLGTAAYMAPEQALGQVIDGRSDLYSLGVVFYEMLVGQRPYDADTVPAMLMQHISAPIPRLPEPQARVQGVLDKLLAKQPGDRYASGAELAAVLEALEREVRGSNDSDILATIAEPTPPKPRVVSPLSRPSRRETPIWPWITGVSLLILLMGLAIWLSRHELSQALVGKTAVVTQPHDMGVGRDPVPLIQPDSGSTPTVTGFYDGIKQAAGTQITSNPATDTTPKATTTDDPGLTRFLGSTQVPTTGLSDATQTTSSQAQPKDSKAAAQYRKSAEAGDARAQVQLGWLYQQGDGVPQDDAVAASWYTKAVVQGDAEAQMYLGWLQQEGKGVAQDYVGAAELFRLAGTQGNAQAQMYLGWLYQEGKGVAQDYEQAATWYRKSAEQGNAQAQMYLGWLNQEGNGVPKNDKLAVRWYQKSADQGNAQAQFYLGWLYQEGRGVKQSDTQAVRWYQKAVAQGHTEAQTFLANLQKEGRVSDD